MASQMYIEVPRLHLGSFRRFGMIFGDVTILMLTVFLAVEKAVP